MSEYSSPLAAERKTVGDCEFFAVVDELLREGKEVLMTPKGNSMLPFIRNGRDTVVLSRLSRNAEVGDILLVKIGNRFVMHRVFSVNGSTITLMGDGNIKGREHCSEADVIGVVTQIRKENGKVVIPGKGRVWRLLLPLRRYLLAIYRRTIL